MEFAIICGMVIGFGVIDRIMLAKAHSTLVAGFMFPPLIGEDDEEDAGEEDEDIPNVLDLMAEDLASVDWDEAWKRQHDKIHGNDNYTDPERNYQIWKREQEKRKRKGERDET